MKVLLSSVFGPYGVDDAFGRKENLMELFHNQVTREQGPFSLRFHHRSFGLYFIAENIHAPTAVLDFPSQRRFIREIKKGYDYVGISFIMPNFVKAKRMAELVREHAPKSRIVLGGHGTMIPGLERMIEHDHICRGEGVKWFRRLLGEDPDRPFTHPILPSTCRKRVLGVPLKAEAAVLIPGVGCPNACRFCCTSHFFGKTYTPYFESGRELFDVCVRIEQATGLREFFVMDENFLKHPARAKELLRLMEEHGKLFRFSIFSSAETVAEVGVEFLARLGVNFLWIGVESKHEIYEKNKGIDLKAMIRALRDHGISVLASGILFLEQHDKETIWDDIRFVVGLESDFVQFMQLGPAPGTGLYADYEAKGLLMKDVPYEEWHGQHRIWFRHPHFTPDESARFLRDAFRYDYDTQGSSLLRLCETAIRGVTTLAQYEDAWMRRRTDVLRRLVSGDFRPMLPAVRKHAHNARARRLAETLIARYDRVLGAASLKQWALSRLVMACAAREVGRHAAGRALCQPGVMETKWRSSLKDLVAARVKGKSLANLLHLHIDWSGNRLALQLGGILDKVNARSLVRKLQRYLKDEDGELVLSLDRLVAVEDEALARLLAKIRKYQDRVKIVFKARGDAVREAVANLPEELAVLLAERSAAPARSTRTRSHA
ncbi:MAG: radical SAM protein [Kiritimatiellae bacterium]|nr:radical SAM protein [Kiritimatiellia bacterium]